MENFVITTENAADLPESYLQENEIGILSLYYTIDGVTYGPGYEPELKAEDFYQRMREGAMPRTQQVNPEQAVCKFRQYLEQGKDILHIALTSAVSGSCNSARMAAEELKEEFPERTITVVDTLVGTLCEGMVVEQVVRMRKAGKTLAEAAQWVRENIPHFCLYATVDDLKHLYRGGRVSKTTALFGTAIGIKPILKLNDDGNLVAVGKVRGRKQSIQDMVNRMEQQIGHFREEKQVIFISHGDCLEDANYLAGLVRERFGYDEFLINSVGPTIGSHSGPGTLALFFLGETR